MPGASFVVREGSCEIECAARCSKRPQHAADAALVQWPTNLSASAPCKQVVQPVWKGGGWLASSALLPEAPGGGESVSVLRGHNRPRGEQERCVGGPSTDPGSSLSLCSAHSSRSFKVILQRGSSDTFSCCFICRSYPVCDCLQEATCASAVFSFVHSTFFSSCFLDGTARKCKRQLLLW